MTKVEANEAAWLLKEIGVDVELVPDDYLAIRTGDKEFGCFKPDAFIEFFEQLTIKHLKQMKTAAMICLIALLASCSKPTLNPVGSWYLYNDQTGSTKMTVTAETVDFYRGELHLGSCTYNGDLFSDNMFLMPPDVWFNKTVVAGRWTVDQPGEISFTYTGLNTTYADTCDCVVIDTAYIKYSEFRMDFIKLKN